jgi:hypothetical protein
MATMSNYKDQNSKPIHVTKTGGNTGYTPSGTTQKSPTSGLAGLANVVKGAISNITGGNNSSPANNTPAKNTSGAPAAGSSYAPPAGGSNKPTGFVPAGVNMSQNDAEGVAYYQRQYERAKAAGDQAGMDQAHSSAESLRAKQGYSGGQDGSQYIQLNQQQQQLQAESIQSVDSIMGGYKQLQNDARSMGDEGLAMLGAQWDKMVQMLDGVEAQITDQIKGQMNGDDPAMKQAISLIKQEAERMRKDTLDELNARGLVQSGVYARALSDMNNTELTQVQSAVASRFGDLQTQLNNAIMSLAQTRISALGANQNAVASMMMNNQSNVLNAGLAGLNASMTGRGQDIQNNQFNQSLAQNQNQFDATYKQNQSQFDSTLSFNKDQLSQSTQQFYDNLKQEDRQFYDSLSSNEKLAYASMAAARSGGGGGSGNSLAAQKFAWEQQVYGQERQDQLNADNRTLTNNLIGAAQSAGGLVDQYTSSIANGQSTMGQLSTFMQRSGYTPEAQSAILYLVQNDPDVQRKISTATRPSARGNVATGTKKYTPSGNTYGSLGR